MLRVEDLQVKVGDKAIEPKWRALKTPVLDAIKKLVNGYR